MTEPQARGAAVLFVIDVVIDVVVGSRWGADGVVPLGGTQVVLR